MTYEIDTQNNKILRDAVRARLLDLGFACLGLSLRYWFVKTGDKLATHHSESLIFEEGYEPLTIDQLFRLKKEDIDGRPKMSIEEAQDKFNIKIIQ